MAGGGGVVAGGGGVVVGGGGGMVVGGGGGMVVGGGGVVGWEGGGWDVMGRMMWGGEEVVMADSKVGGGVSLGGVASGGGSICMCP